jgi:serpin B
MNRRRTLALSGALLAGALAGCTASGRQPDRGDTTTEPRDDATTEPGSAPAPAVDEEALTELVQGTNSLAFDLYGTVRSDHQGENLLASPVSITTALAMAYAGARGDTREQMREALNYTLDDDILHAAFEALQSELDSRGDDLDEDDLPSNYDAEDDPVPFQLNLVNAAWGQTDYPFREDYLTLLEDHYGGGLEAVDYASDPEAAREEINAWVADQTEDRIEDLLPKGALNQLTRLVLTNAVYFLANWHHPFEESATSTQSFTALDGSTTEVPTMSQSETFPYADVDGVQAVDLPYIGEAVSMLVVLPPEGEFEAYERDLDRSALTQLVEALDAREGSVSLPRFEFESGFTLKQTLEAAGMSIAFSQSDADFSGMAHLDQTGENLYVDNVYHDTYIAVDEEGTEAAAATGVVMKATGAPADPFEFVADRPFLFAIRDRPTDTILFLGRVVDAGAAQ